MVIRQSTKVKNDLADCLWDGLVIGAPGITIDLDGHTIDGKGLGAGIRNDGYDNVTIKNGRVVDFDYGVALNVGTEKNIVEHARRSRRTRRPASRSATCRSPTRSSACPRPSRRRRRSSRA